MCALLINESPLQILPTLAQKVGVNEALVLQQIHYWLTMKSKRSRSEGCQWVHNTYEQWQSQFPFWSVRTVQRILLTLEQRGLLRAFAKGKFQKTKHYTIDYDRLNALQKSVPEDETSTSRQVDVIEQPLLSHRARQVDVIDHDKLARSIYLTETTYTENTPPLTPPHDGKEDDEEEFSEKSGLPSHQEVVDVWNTHVQSRFPKHTKALLTAKREQQIDAFFRETLVSDLASWERYCQTIARLRFLMGESSSGFRVTLEWALKPENACKVLEGAFYDKAQSSSGERQETDAPWREHVDVLKQHCAEHDYSDRWFEACKVLSVTCGQAIFRSWFQEIVPAEKQGVLYLNVQNDFLYDYIVTNYQDTLQKAVSASFPHGTRLEIQVGGDPPSSPALSAAGAGQADEDLKQDALGNTEAPGSTL